MSPFPLLSVCIPTYNRPDLLERALRSVVDAPVPDSGAVEIIVSDNSTDERSQELCAGLLASWDGPTRYVLNRPGVGAVPNFNCCLDLATGTWVLILHDDDYLVDGVAALLDAIHTAADSDMVQLFGVHVVDQHQRVRKHQTFNAEVRLLPEEALARVLSDSSWVRFPGLVARRDAYQAVGPFNVDVKDPTDLDMWIRLFARYGVRCLPVVSSAYTVHVGALTERMFSHETVDTLAGIFDAVVAQNLLPEDQVRRHQADFIHQFILGATWRRLRVRDLAGARETMQLFGHPAVRSLGVSKRWAAVRVVFRALTLQVPGMPR